MAHNEVEISFKVDIEATSHEQIENAVNRLLDQLGNIDTDLSWEDVQWRLTFVGEPLTRLEQA
jgi:hypothetical protein